MARGGGPARGRGASHHAPGAIAGLVLALCGHAGGALAQPAAAATAPAAPRVEDTMAQRVLACTGCHGKQGRAARDGYYPRIAGKPAGYLLHQLQAFRDGRRPYAPMAKLLAPLGDAYLREIAEHFAALDLPYPAPPPLRAEAASLRLGERLTLQGDAARGIPACRACHGAALTGVAPAVPGLLGLPPDYLIEQLGAWRTHQRASLAPDCMAEIARRLAPPEITALAQWLAAQPLPASAQPAPARTIEPPLACGGVP